MGAEFFSYYLSGSEGLKKPSGGSAGEKIKNYVVNNFTAAQKAGKEFGLNPVVILAQGSIESAWGTSHIARKHHNYFGVTAYGKPNQYWSGEKYISKSSGLPFRSYKNPVDSFSDYARLISAKYPEAARNSFSVEKFAHSIAYSPYISEKNGDKRPVYKNLIIRNAESIEKILRENSLIKSSEKSGGFLGMVALAIFGWLGYDYLFNEKDEA